MLVGRLPANVAVRHQRGRHALGRDLLARLAERQRLGLGEAGWPSAGRGAPPSVVARPHEADEVARDQRRALVHQLVVGVLAVRARACPTRSGPVGSVDRLAVEVAPTCRSTPCRAAAGTPGSRAQVLAVGQHRVRLGAEEVARTRRRSAPAARAGCARTAPCGSARRSRGTRRASRGSRSGPMATISDRPIAESTE